MLNIFARSSVSRVADPLGAGLVRFGLSANAITLVGTVGSVCSALWFFPRGQLFVGTVVVAVFLLFDLLDGAMARAGGGSSHFGAVLDASCDRLVDGVLFGSLVWWALLVDGDRIRGFGLLVGMVCAQVISYVKARAEANGLHVGAGLAERAERFIVLLVGTGLHGLGVPHVLDVAVWLLAALTAFTVVQRLVSVREPEPS